MEQEAGQGFDDLGERYFDQDDRMCGGALTKTRLLRWAIGYGLFMQCEFDSVAAVPRA